MNRINSEEERMIECIDQQISKKKSNKSNKSNKKKRIEWSNVSI